MERSSAIFGNLGTQPNNWYASNVDITSNRPSGKHVCSWANQRTVATPFEVNSRNYAGASNAGSGEL